MKNIGSNENQQALSRKLEVTAENFENSLGKFSRDPCIRKYFNEVIHRKRCDANLSPGCRSVRWRRTFGCVAVSALASAEPANLRRRTNCAPNCRPTLFPADATTKNRCLKAQVNKKHCQTNYRRFQGFRVPRMKVNESSREYPWNIVIDVEGTSVTRQFGVIRANLARRQAEDVPRGSGENSEGDSTIGAIRTFRRLARGVRSN